MFKVYIVNNLNDDGEGSFRQAAEANKPRITVSYTNIEVYINELTK